MVLSEQVKKMVHNINPANRTKDFRIQMMSLFVYILFLGASIWFQFFFAPATPFLNIIYIAAGATVVLTVLAVLPSWWQLFKALAAGWIAVLVVLDSTYMPLLVGLTVGLIAAPSIQIAEQWEKAIVLRFGKFRRIKGPGIFLIIAPIERIVEFVDTRIRATDFSAETTLTRDTVPVNVDAIAFWMIWDPKKAILELENFLDAIVLSAQTALRDAIGKHELATLLSERDKLGKEIQEILEAKTSPWGITILSVEIREIIIPKELQDAMSRRAQAERERQARVILGTAEAEIAVKFAEAAELYKDNPTALQLRAMNMIYEGLRKNGSIILLPSSAVETMSLGTVLATNQAVNQAKKAEEKNTSEKEE